MTSPKYGYLIQLATMAHVLVMRSYRHWRRDICISHIQQWRLQVHAEDDAFMSEVAG